MALFCKGVIGSSFSQTDGQLCRIGRQCIRGKETRALPNSPSQVVCLKSDKTAHSFSLLLLELPSDGSPVLIPNRLLFLCCSLLPSR